MDARKILENAYTLGFDVLPSLALGLASLEDILKEHNSPLLAAMYRNTKKIIGSSNIFEDNVELYERRTNFLKESQIIEREFISSHEGLLEIRRIERLGTGPLSLVPSVMSYDSKVEEVGQELLGYLKENFLLINKWYGLIFIRAYEDGKREYIISRRPMVHLIWKEDKDMMDKSLFLDVIPSMIGEILKIFDDALTDEYRVHIYRWATIRGLREALGKDPEEITKALLNRDEDIINKLKDTPHFKEVKEFLESYWRIKGNLAYQLGLLLESYGPGDIAYFLNEADEPKIDDPIERAKFAKDVTSVFRNMYSRVLIIPKGLLDEYLNVFDRIYNLLNGGYDPEVKKIFEQIGELERSSEEKKNLEDLYNKLYDKISFAVPIQALWVIYPKGKTKRVGRESFSEITVYLRWDGQEFHL